MIINITFNHPAIYVSFRRDDYDILDLHRILQALVTSATINNIITKPLDIIDRINLLLSNKDITGIIIKILNDNNLQVCGITEEDLNETLKPTGITTI